MTSKIPGFLPPMPRTEIDGKIEKLDNKSIPELLELIGRQNKILANKRFVNSLPDKGQKVQSFLNRLKHELALRNRLEQSCNLLSKMSLNSSHIDKNTVQNLEWVRQKNVTKHDNEYLDSDDDSEPEDPLAIVAQKTDVKKVVILQKETPLITEEDLKEIQSFSNETSHSIDKDKVLDEYCEQFFDRTVNKAKVKDNFKPYKTTVSNSHDPSKEMLRKKGKHWEVTAATPNPSVHGYAKEISLKESLLLLDEQNKHLKEVQVKYAAEKLSTQLGISDIKDVPSSLKGAYREVHSEDSENEWSGGEGSDTEVLDEEPQDGGVTFTVMN